MTVQFQEFHPNDDVLINSGPYKGLTGVLVSVDTSTGLAYVDLHEAPLRLILPFDHIDLMPEDEDEDDEDEDTDDYEEREVVLELHDEVPGKRVIILVGQFMGEAGRLLGPNTRLSEDVGEEIVNVHLENGGFLTAVAKRNVVASVYQGEALNV